MNATGLLLISAVFASAAAFAAPPPQGHERIPVVHLQLEGPAKFESVVLPVSPNPNLLTHVCFREYGAPAIRCYTLDITDPTKPVWLTVDLELAQ